MSRLRVVAASLGVLLGLAALMPPAGAAGFLEKNFWLSGPRYDGILPPCDHPGALDTIVSRFATKESRFWNSALQLTGFERVREIAYRPGAPNLIPRRYCSAVALVSDGRKRRVYYWIGEDTGFAGLNWGVEWCVVGLDRNWAYNPGCRMARP